MSAAVIKLKAVTTPSGKHTFNRWVAAVPNMAGNVFGKEGTSFRAPYFLIESSDMVDMDPQITLTFLDDLKRMGFTTLQYEG